LVVYSRLCVALFQNQINHEAQCFDGVRRIAKYLCEHATAFLSVLIACIRSVFGSSSRQDEGKEEALRDLAGIFHRNAPDMILQLLPAVVMYEEWLQSDAL
jgi:hypothetical protein